MKRIPLIKSALTATICAFLMTSCFFAGDEVVVNDSFEFPETTGIYSVEIKTNSPDIKTNEVEFRGEIATNDNSVPVEFGFMYYDPNNVESTNNPTRVAVGKTTGSREFTAAITGLTPGQDWVVCAFVEDEETTERNIGEEVNFVLP